MGAVEVKVLGTIQQPPTDSDLTESKIAYSVTKDPGNYVTINSRYLHGSQDLGLYRGSTVTAIPVFEAVKQARERVDQSRGQAPAVEPQLTKSMNGHLQPSLLPTEPLGAAAYGVVKPPVKR